MPKKTTAPPAAPAATTTRRAPRSAGFSRRVTSASPSVDVPELSVVPSGRRALPTPDAATAWGRLPGVRPSATRSPEGGGIVASAKLITERDAKARDGSRVGSGGKVADWQEEAWELLDQVGEQRFLCSTLAGRMSQAALYVGEVDPDSTPGTAPAHSDDSRLTALLSSLGGGPAGQSQILNRAGANLFVAGECWLVGIPPRLVPGTDEYEEAAALAEAARSNGRAPAATGLVDRSGPIESVHEASTDDDILSLVWRLLSVSELSISNDAEATLTFETGEKVKAAVDDLFLIRIWRPHPRYSWQADSPTRASLPVLRELQGLTMHIGAQIDSRLAGAGLLEIPSSVEAAAKRAAGLDESDPRNPVAEALMDAMMTPIEDRSSPAALVPLILTVPDSAEREIKHTAFSTPLDENAAKLRDEAIRRLALGQDAPPELLLGQGGMNHWGAWLVREDVVNTHLEPPLALVCDALTTQFLRPILRMLGYSDDEIGRYVIWYDVDHLIARPNRTQDAKDARAVGAISDIAFREALGFGEDAAPDDIDATPLAPAVQTALTMVERAPSLAQNPGLPRLVQQIQAIMGDQADIDAAAAEPVAVTEEVIAGEPRGETTETTTESGPPASSPDDAPSGTPAA